ncbi:hypothetical protein ACFFX1_54445, partial [Dactylosporangium sucinum]
MSIVARPSHSAPAGCSVGRARGNGPRNLAAAAREAVEPLARALVLRLSAPDPDSVRQQCVAGYLLDERFDLRRFDVVEL